MTTSLSLELPADSTAPAAARKLVGGIDHIPDHAMPDVVLLVSELVSNSVRHGSPTPEGRVLLKLEVTATSVRAEVEDQGSGFDIPIVEPASEGTGMGLKLVDRVADRWGIGRDPTTVVWFELDVGRPMAHDQH